MSVGVGDVAPDFTLDGVVDGNRQTVSLSDYRGQPVIIVFYPGDGTPICTKQLNAYNDDLDRFEQLGAQVIAISAKDVDSKAAFANRYGLKFPLLADDDKVVAGDFGTLGPVGFPRRSVFIVDADGVIRYAHRAVAGLTFRPVAELESELAKL